MPLPLYVPPKNPPAVMSSTPKSRRPGQAESSVRGLVGNGGPLIGYGATSECIVVFVCQFVSNNLQVPVFDCTRFFQPRRAGEFSSMSSLLDFFSQAGSEVCPQIIGKEIRKMSVVGICYSANKWRADDGSMGNFNLGFNVRGVYLLVNGPKA